MSVQGSEGLLQVDHRTGSVPVAQPKFPSISLSEPHSPSRACAGAQLSPPACAASPEPLPQLLLLNRSQQAESKQKQQLSVASAACSSALRHHHPVTLRHHPQPQASGQASSPFSIIPVISRLPCSLTPEELHQIAHVGGNDAEQAACCLHSMAQQASCATALEPSCRNSS